jgi:hypothetical protein
MPEGWDVIYYRTADNHCPGDEFLEPRRPGSMVTAALRP